MKVPMVYYGAFLYVVTIGLWATLAAVVPQYIRHMPRDKKVGMRAVWGLLGIMVGVLGYFTLYYAANFMR